MRTNPKATQPEIDNLVGQIELAIENLVSLVPLRSKLEEIGNLDQELYTEESWASLLIEIQFAQDVLENINATNENVGEAINKLNLAVEDLVLSDPYAEYLATDDDFTWINNSSGYTATNETSKGYYKYIGDKTTVKIPHEINGHPMTSYYRMFLETSVEKVISDNSNVTGMKYMFQASKATSLDLSNFDTSNVTNMYGMFRGSQATTLDLSNFDTSNVTNMGSMFNGSQATTGYARTQADADRFNSSSPKPSGLSFIVKP